MSNEINKLVPHLFRNEYSKMTAVLSRHFGLKHIEIAEDIASDTFLKASEIWAIKGVPENPVAWLYPVAKNKTKDYIKHNIVIESNAKESLLLKEITTEVGFEFSSQNIADSQLAMIFAVCNPINSTEAQICLALQILCGFSVEEIANAFLTQIETIKKRLQRARTNLRNSNFQIKPLNADEINTRLDNVLRILYLLFNEGYFSKSNNQLIRKELCLEAVRLTLLLAENKSSNLPKANALLALMCFQSSRLDTRINNNGDIIFFDEQDKNLWDKTLIEKGNYYLITACNKNEFSKYHIEASIAYWHTSNAGEEKWKHILQLYNQLLLIDYSPIAALNKTFVLSKVNGKKTAIVEAEKLQLNNNHFYYTLLGELYTDIDNKKAQLNFKIAFSLAKNKTDKQAIKNKIANLHNLIKQ